MKGQHRFRRPFRGGVQFPAPAMNRGVILNCPYGATGGSLVLSAVLRASIFLEVHPVAASPNAFLRFQMITLTMPSNSATIVLGSGTVVGTKGLATRKPRR